MGEVLSAIGGIAKNIKDLKDKRDTIKERRALKQLVKDNRAFLVKNSPFRFDRETRKKMLKPDHPYSDKSIMDNLNNGILPPGYTILELRELGYNDEVNNMLKNKNDFLVQNIHDMNEALMESKKALNKNGITKFDNLVNAVIKEKDPEIYLDKLNFLLSRADIEMKSDQIEQQNKERAIIEKQKLDAAELQLLKEEDLAVERWLDNVKKYNW